MHNPPHAGHENHEGYEKRDAHPKPIVIFCIGLCVLAVIVHLALYFLYAVFKNTELSQDRPAAYVSDERWKSPEIKLEVHPSREYEQMRADEDARLTSYAWRDPASGRVSVPVEKAMELLLKKGLPVREQGAGAEGEAS